MSVLEKGQQLKKELGLFDVFAISTGAMFSSGFFLLPGLAAAKAGPAVVLAYLLAGVLILPAMFSAAELSTALPRAGGAYYFLDRSLGPMAGTVGGLGTYFALTLKTAFALIGIGAYAAFFVELPIKSTAVALTIAFMVLNVFGAKETTTLQRWLVIVLVSVLALFTLNGIWYVAAVQPHADTVERFGNFMPFGMSGTLATVGFVFVSYAGLTKVASVAEEVKNPDRNLPLGMMLSLGVTSIIYVVGVFIIVAVVDANDLRSDLTPVATAAKPLFEWLPGSAGLILIVAAALAAFASTGNAGLLSSSRYPLAMARDRLLPQGLAKLSRFQTPVRSIVVTGGIMIFFIVVLDAEGIAKLASAFQLFIFVLINLAVVVMRESRIPSYDPGYHSPFYPWMQIFGMITSLALIGYMGWMAVVFIVVVTAACLLWYHYYARENVVRDGAIYHWFQRLGQRHYEALDREFRGILKEKGLREDDPFEEIVARSAVLDLREKLSFEDVLAKVSAMLAGRLTLTAEEIHGRFMDGTRIGETPVTRGVALPHFRTTVTERAEMVLVRSHEPIAVPGDNPLTPEVEGPRAVRTMFCLVSSEQDPAQHLRILAQIAGRVDEDTFATAWAEARNEEGLREVLLRDERFLKLRIGTEGDSADLVGKALAEVRFPETCLVAMVRRGELAIIPKGSTRLEAGDELTIIGDPVGVAAMVKRYAKHDG